MRRYFNPGLSAVLAGAAFLSPLFGQDSKSAPTGQQIPPPTCLVMRGVWQGGYTPCTPHSYDQWLADIRHWRFERRIRVGYSPSRYDDAALRWTQSSFIQPQMMVQDRYLYDPMSGKYTVDRYLDDLEKRYGGIDAVLVWSTYPNMGIDDRNQLQMVDSMPGGVVGVREMVDQFHRRGVRVLFPMMMWDQGTHEPDQAWPDSIAKLMKEIGADGINGDTQDGVPLAFSLAAEQIDHPLAFEPEHSPSDEALGWNVLTWGQYTYSLVPTVDRFRWLEPRHQVNIQDRWSRSKNDDLQFAFFNGEGWESWENVWGIWNGLTARDAEATRQMASIERAVAPFLVSQEWQPFFPMNRYGVFASRWPLAGQTVWTIVNRNEYDVAGRQMKVPFHPGERYFDLYHGVELAPARDGEESVLSFPIEAHGFGALLAISGQPSSAMAQLMARMKAMTEKPLSSYSREWKPLEQTIVSIAPTKLVDTTPSGMVRIDGGEFLFAVKGTEIEGGDDVGVDVQYPWEDTPRRFHEHEMTIKSFYMDKYPVTNQEFSKFIEATHYAPADKENFLKDWTGGKYPDGWGDKPVTWVSLEDARAYARWAGKRLPHEWEWQYAAQGADGRIFPWGNCGWSGTGGGVQPCSWATDASSQPAPLPDKGRTMLPPANVNAHPKGVSPFGVMDMVGNVWQWTDEYQDEHTRAAILRGGSHYQPQGSIWYFPQAYENGEHSKLLMMSPGYDRSGAIGFRCVVDAAK